jgi:hypothetical protein
MAVFIVLRLLTPLGMSYAAARRRGSHTKIVEELTPEGAC